MNKSKVKLSIIIPTIGRIVELSELLKSLEMAIQNLTYEIIIVDQNQLGYLDDCLKKFNDNLNIIHHNVSFRGLSKAKNFGVKIAQGNFLTFPDDDCKVFPNSYSKALQLIDCQGIDVVFGRCVDSKGVDSVLKFKNAPYLLNESNMLGGFVEATGVISKRVFEHGFLFDENMGAGCFHGAQEGYDWLYRILSTSNLKAFYTPDVIFYHPQVLMDKGSLQSLKRVFTYSCGTAYLCKKHHFYFKLIIRLTLVMLSLPVYLIFNRKNARYYFAELLGLLSGLVIS
jgi:glycosyltransferase involved in cell wall biosynthesis